MGNTSTISVVQLDIEGFFNGFGLWNTPGVHQPEDAWSRTSGATPSINTGPIGGSGTDRAADPIKFYAFTEASVDANGPWSMESPEIDASLRVTTLTFDLFMKFEVDGNIEDGTLLVQGWDGVAWSPIGNAIVGSQQTSDSEAWKASTLFGTYDSTDFTNTDFKFRFLFTRGASPITVSYDCAIDNVTLTGPISSTFTPVGLIDEFRGEDGVDNFPHNLNFPEPEHGHTRENITTPPHLVFAGTQSFKIEIKPGDNQWSVDEAVRPRTPKRRAEFEWNPESVRFKDREDGWIGFAFYLPSDPMANVRGCAFWQLHQHPDDRPLVICSVFGGKIQIRCPSHPDSRPPPDEFRIVDDFDVGPHLDTWRRLICRFLPSPVDDDGIIKLWLDDVLIADITGANKTNGSRGPYFKNGCYFWGYERFDSNKKAVCYFDNIRLGGPTSNYDSVNPANWS